LERHLARAMQLQRAALELDRGARILQVVARVHLAQGLVYGVDQLLTIELRNDVERRFSGCHTPSKDTVTLHCTMVVRDAFGIAILIGVLVLAPLGATSPYFLITPGGTYDIGSRLRVPDEYRKPMGRMAFTAVFEQEASWGEVAHARVAGQAEIVPAVAI